MTGAPPPSRTYTILHTESSLGWGGQERRILAEAQVLQARGHRLLLAGHPRGELLRRGHAANFQVFPLPFGGWGNLKAWRTLWRLLVDEQVDILNTHSSLDSWLGTLAWRSLPKRPRLIRTRHLSTPVRPNWPTRWLYNTPAAVITTSQAIKELLHRRLGVPTARLFSIPTGVSLVEFAPRPPDPDLKAGLGLPPDAWVFGTVAVLRSWKGHLYLLEALQRLLQGGRDAYLLLVGDGPYRPVIEARVQELELTSRVRLVGYRDQVAPWLALMDVFVFPSYANEGVPQAVLQALAMGKPVVGTTVGGIPEVIRPGETGVLAPPREAEALAQAMDRFMGDPAFSRRLGEQGRALVAARYSLEEMARRVEEVYAWTAPESLKFKVQGSKL